MNRILAALGLVSLLASVGLMAYDEPTVTASLDVVRHASPVDQPLALRLTVTNRSKSAQVFSINYPTLVTAGTSGLEFTLDGHKLVPKCLPTENCSFFQGDGRIPAMEIPATGQVSLLVILNRFSDRSFSQGEHELKYHLTLVSRDSAKIAASTTGTIRFTMTDSNDRELIATLQDWSKSLGSSNYWERRSALEAISLTDSPVAIPYKITLIKAGYPEYAFPSLAKFRNNDDARKAVVAAIAENWTRVAACALRVLSLWKEPIKPEEIAKLATSEDAMLRQAVIEYCDSVKSPDLAGIVMLLAHDTDPEIAQSAKRLLQK